MFIIDSSETHNANNKKGDLKKMELIKENLNPLTLEKDFKTDYFLSFINYLDLSDTTIKSYKGALKVFSDYLSANNITKPTREDIIAYRTYLIDKGYKPTSIHSYINSVKEFFKWLDYSGLYKNIAINIKGIRISNSIHRKDSLTLDQAQDLLNYFKRDTLESKRDYALTLLALNNGFRTIEIARADINDLTNKNGYRVLYVRGKGHQEKDRTSKVSALLDNAIRDYLSMRKPLNESEPLFTSISDRNNGGRLTTRSIRRIIKNALRGIGLDSERLSAHSLRHTTATLNIMLGGTLEETQELLRHENPNTTMIYINETNESKNKSVYRLEKALLTNKGEY